MSTLPNNANISHPDSAEVAAKILRLSLEVQDPEVIAELSRHAEGRDRNRFALAALRLGVLSIRSAAGELDGRTIREAGDRLMADVRELLTHRTNDMTSLVVQSLSQYFDPSNGSVTGRLNQLFQRGGELEAVLASQLNGEGSVLSNTLVSHLGEASPLFKMLSPEEADGLRARLGEATEQALVEHRQSLLREFSLDAEDSALSRLVREVGEQANQVSGDMKKQVEVVVSEFSLDRPDSALSRLVSRVEQTQKTITGEFSLDRKDSALSRMTDALSETRQHIDRQLTLDDDGSALSRLRREVMNSIEKLAKGNADFHSEVRDTLTALDARKKESQRGPRHGDLFEEQLGQLLAEISVGAGDIHASTGSSTGIIKNCKVGDHVTKLGPESAAPGAKLVWEAKQKKNYGVLESLEEIETAQKNREAQVGVFVFSAERSPQGIDALARFGNSLVVIWDANDPATDIYIRAAYSLAKALVVRATSDDSESCQAIRELELAARAIEKQLSYFEDIRKWASTISNNSDKILKKSDTMLAKLSAEVERVDDMVSRLRQAGDEAA